MTDIPKIEKQFLIKEYCSAKKKLIELTQKDKFEEALDYAEYCAKIAQKYPILPAFVDDELELMIAEIAKRITKNNDNDLKLTKKRIVFYNSQIIDQGALTEQYLHYFLKNKYEILFIIPDKKKALLGQGILNTIQGHDNVTIFIPQKTKKIQKICEIIKHINEFKPEIAFLHFVPNDIVGFSSFSQLEYLTRYYIVHNDHTFWLGKHCSDYFIEFRKFGYELAIHNRGIDPAKLFMLPFYPIIHKRSFKGFPFDPKGKIIGVSGAALYKYCMDPDLSYFYAIKELLINNKDFIFCLAGRGDKQKIVKFINENQLQNRFYFIGFRDDFYSLVGECDILFESYPLRGGLTVLYATEQAKCVIGIGNEKTPTSTIEDYLQLQNFKEARSINEFLKEADELIKSPAKRRMKADLFKHNKYNQTDFELGLEQIIYNNFDFHKQPLYRSKSDLDLDVTLHDYIALEDSKAVFLEMKLFMLRKRINFIGRIKLLFTINKYGRSLSFKRIVRLLLA